MRKCGLLVLVIALSGCGGEESITVTKNDFGEKWPLSVESGQLICDGTAVVIKTDKGDFRLNGGNGKKNYEFLDTSNIQLIDQSMWQQLGKPDDFKPRMDVSGLIKRGEVLCKST